MKKSVAELHFFPCLEYFYHFNQSDVFYIEAHESFQKQTYRSRCEILGSNGVLSLNIPVIHGKTRQSIQTTCIEYTQNWVPTFWKTLEASYKRSPYFDYFEMVFKPLLFQREQHLFTLNLQLLKGCMKFLNITTEIVLTSSFIENSEEVLDLRNTIYSKRKVEKWLFPSYPQNFGDQFVNNLSIIDLIMNEGPAGSLVFSKPTFLA